MSVNWKWVKEWMEKEPVLIWRLYGYPEVTDVTKTQYGPTIGVEVQPKWDIPDKIVIVTAIVGAFYSKRQNPNHPASPEETQKSAEECLAAGCPSVHVHVRRESEPGWWHSVLDFDLFNKVIGGCKKKYPNAVYDACLIWFTKEELPHFERAVEAKLVEVSPVNPTACFAGDLLFTKPPHVLIQKTKMLQDAGIKPQVAIYTDGDIDNANRYLIKTGLLEKPYYWIILPTLPGGSPYYDPFTMAYGLAHKVQLIQKIDPESVIIVCCSGRASSYLGTLAMLLGLHVRCGMEDTIFRWPHKDDRIQTNVGVYKSMATIAKELGRDIISPDEYRKLIGLK